MGGEGSMMAAINSLKNNRSLLSKRKEKNALSGSYSHVGLKEFPKATPQQLKEIRLKIQAENRKLRIKLIFVFWLIILVLASFFVYFIQ